MGLSPVSISDPSRTWTVRSDDGVTLVDFVAIGALDPEDWVYRTADGTRLDIRRVFGLRKLTDRNANSLTFTQDGITHNHRMYPDAEAHQFVVCERLARETAIEDGAHVRQCELNDRRLMRACDF